MKRAKDQYSSLFHQYCDLDSAQMELLGDAITPPAAIRAEYDELQVKKIAILEEMEKIYEKK